MSTLIIGLLFVVVLTVAYVALRNARDFADANEVIPGIKTSAPKEWAGAHSAEARLHRRLRDSMTTLRESRSLDAADLVDIREALEREALTVDAHLVAVASLPSRQKTDAIGRVEDAVTAIEDAVADVVLMRGPSVADVRSDLAKIRTRLTLVREARAELAAMSPGSLEDLRTQLEVSRAAQDAAPDDDARPDDQGGEIGQSGAAPPENTDTAAPDDDPNGSAPGTPAAGS